MKNILTIYKFSFPFIKNKYEEVLFNSIFSDINELLLYEEIEYKPYTKEQSWITVKTFILLWSKIELIFNKTEDYYIPKFQLNFFIDDNINYKILIKIINIFETFWLHSFIFDYDYRLNKYFKDFNLQDIKYLENNFKLYTEKKLYDFLKNSHKDYIEDELKSNRVILDSFIYLIYIWFIMSKNDFDINKLKDNINILKNNEISEDYLSTILLSERRLDFVNDITISNIKKYRNMIDMLFKLFE